MEIKKRENNYGHMVIDCPFCKEWVYVRGSADPRELYRHMLSAAKREAFQSAMGEVKETPHLVYFKEHTKPKILPVVSKRQFDDDIKVI